MCKFFAFGAESGYSELLASQAESGYLGQDELVADCLDHAYFLEELKKLLQMTERCESDLFKRRVCTRQGTQLEGLCLA